MKLGVFLAIGESFQDYRSKGQESLMVDYHLRNYSQSFEKVYVFSYADEHTKYFNNVTVLPNKWHLHRYAYALLLPILNIKYIKKVDIIRGFQISGGIPGMVSKLFLNKKFVINYGYDYIKFAQLEEKPIQSLLYRILSSFILNTADKIIITAKYLNKSILNKFKNKIVHIPNGVDTKIFKKLNIQKDIDILFVGRFEKQKNLFALIKAVGLVKKKKLKVLFVGSGNLKNDLIKQADIHNVNLQIIDSIPHNQIPRIYNRSKVFILPSFIEGQPKALLEAMSCGLPVIASNISAHREIIRNKTNGILCGLNIEEIAQSISYIYQHLNIRNKISENARNTIIMNYSKSILNKKEINLLINI